jgi:hypothetical protein
MFAQANATSDLEDRGHILASMPTCDGDGSGPAVSIEMPMTANPFDAEHRPGQFTWRISGALGGADVHSWMDGLVPEGAPTFRDDPGVVLSQSASIGVYTHSRGAFVATEHYHLYFNATNTTVASLGVAYKFAGRTSSTSCELGPAIGAISSGSGDTVLGLSLLFDVLIAPGRPFGAAILGDLELFNQGNAHIFIVHVGGGFGGGK